MWLIIRVQILNNVDKEIRVNLVALDGTGETVLRVILWSRVILWEVPSLLIRLRSRD